MGCTCLKHTLIKTGTVVEGRPALGCVPDRAGRRHERDHVPLPGHDLHAPVQHEGAVAREGLGRRGCSRRTAHERERVNPPLRHACFLRYCQCRTFCWWCSVECDVGAFLLQYVGPFLLKLYKNCGYCIDCKTNALSTTIHRFASRTSDAPGRASLHGRVRLHDCFVWVVLL